MIHGNRRRPAERAFDPHRRLRHALVRVRERRPNQETRALALINYRHPPKQAAGEHRSTPSRTNSMPYRFVNVKVPPSRRKSTRLRKLMPSRALDRFLPSMMTASTLSTAISPTHTVSSLIR